MTTQSITTTPMAPYEGLMKSMSRSEKLVVISFLTDSLKEDERQKLSAKGMLKPNPFKNFKSESELTDNDRAQLVKEIKDIKISSQVNQLVSALSLSAEEMEDEKTKYLLGVE